MDVRGACPSLHHLPSSVTGGRPAALGENGSTRRRTSVWLAKGALAATVYWWRGGRGQFDQSTGGERVEGSFDQSTGGEWAEVSSTSPPVVSRRRWRRPVYW